jgi:hypothetical protein
MGRLFKLAQQVPDEATLDEWLDNADPPLSDEMREAVKAHILSLRLPSSGKMLVS